MKILVIGGTRFFGIHLVNSLLARGHNVTIATRGNAKDVFGDKVERIIIERNDPSNLKETIGRDYYDVVYDNIAYSSNDIKGLLNSLKCGRYIMTSSASVYTNQHLQTSESEFDPTSYPLKWCFREDFPYNEAKRQAESALFQIYPQFESVAVRLPYVIGQDDYTKRLYFYVEQIIKGNPINLDNLNEQIGFIDSADAGDFLAWMADQKFAGAINGNSNGTISLKEVIDYVELKTNKKAIYSAEGLEGPYNGQKSFDLDVRLANKLGYSFTELNSWIYELLDKCIIMMEEDI
ncbi:NAD-dependent epimerase/dehydratase family protein [Clostridium sp. YIM B02505]|uniref:UDP-glucose 4-epimerase n=1 Tax=Clostridium yunnanense TaxID=2800325 RepID=A0ABS1EVB7_9CLOT|nr:NAD-dependent epimerase/dehydratase family protein [Clostridium yunnanense]MBK1813245.1 NAD-dependent epimerase/dehydratase family protein [Clostridium yunnanense]